MKEAPAIAPGVFFWRRQLLKKRQPAGWGTRWQLGIGSARIGDQKLDNAPTLIRFSQSFNLNSWGNPHCSQAADLTFSPGEIAVAVNGGGGAIRIEHRG